MRKLGALSRKGYYSTTQVPSSLQLVKPSQKTIHTKMSRFYFGSDSDSDSNDPDSLPFPAPLSREAFSAEIDAPFSPTAFLATLRHRHHTLEDLRSELRTRSKDLEKELVELVNRDYVDFVGLGSSLSGGDGKAEDLKMGLWGFRRDVEGVVSRIDEVAKEVERQLKVREGIRKQKVCLSWQGVAFTNADLTCVDACKDFIGTFTKT